MVSQSGISAKVFLFLSILLFIQLLSAVLLATISEKPVADEKEGHYHSVCHYIKNGITIKSLQNHPDFVGPGSHIWVALWSKVFGKSLVALRLSIFLSWIIVFGIMGLMWKILQNSALVIAGFILPFQPHFTIFAGMIMTEGPSFAFLFLALFLYAIAEQYERNEKEHFVKTLIAYSGYISSGICIGITIWCRQYFMAIIPAVLTAAYLRKSKSGKLILLAMGPIISLTLMLFLWKGFTSYGVAALQAAKPGSEGARWMDVAFNWARPLTALIYAGLYSLPFLPWSYKFLKSREIFLLGGVGIFVALLFMIFHCTPYGWGPILTIIRLAKSRLGIIGTISEFLLTAAGVFGFTLWVSIMVSEYSKLSCDSLGLVSILFVPFFIFEQVGVGGNVHFYEKYIFHVVFFSGVSRGEGFKNQYEIGYYSKRCLGCYGIVYIVAICCVCMIRAKK